MLGIFKALKCLFHIKFLSSSLSTPTNCVKESRKKVNNSQGWTDQPHHIESDHMEKNRPFRRGISSVVTGREVEILKIGTNRFQWTCDYFHNLPDIYLPDIDP